MNPRQLERKSHSKTGRHVFLTKRPTGFLSFAVALYVIMSIFTPYFFLLLLLLLLWKRSAVTFRITTTTLRVRSISDHRPNSFASKDKGNQIQQPSACSSDARHAVIFLNSVNCRTVKCFS